MPITSRTRWSQRPRVLRLIYRSQVAFNPVGMPFTEEVQAILSESRAHNAAVGITGALMVSRGHFAQVLEGPASAVKALYGGIACDARHRHPLVLSVEDIDRRAFPNWSMAYVNEVMQAAIPLTFRDAAMDPSSLSASGPALLAFLRYAVQEMSPEAISPRPASA
ncbi:BLUF domain-containing protein [Muricoccus radiodurans]|uniref:BLUF domain-containing protein n=1 Tax=Muricoccus radiodurans TaxID=2231721 RepID=UPI003CE7736B